MVIFVPKMDDFWNVRLKPWIVIFTQNKEWKISVSGQVPAEYRHFETKNRQIFKFSFETFHKKFSLGSVSAKNFYFWIKIDKYKNICTFLTYGILFLLLLFRYFLLNKCLPVRIWFQKRRRAAEKVSFWSHFSFLRFQNHVTVVLFSEFNI